MMKIRVSALVILLACALSAGCGSSPSPVNESPSEASQAAAETPQSAGSESGSGAETGDGSESGTGAESGIGDNTVQVPEDLLVFHNQAGEPFSAQIRPELKKHDYNFDNLHGEGLEKTYTDEKYQSRLGVDLSRYQEKADWEKLKEQGVEFAILRIGYTGYGEGTLHEDSMFEEHYEGARLAGMDIGVYWFSQATTVEEAEDEAGEAVAIMEERELELPIFFDEEFITGDKGRADDLTPEQLTANAVAFCEVVKELGYTPGVYCNMEWEAFQYDLAQLEDYVIWYADYDPAPQTPYDFEFWQFTQSGKVNGIKGDVDLNLQFIR